MSSVEQPVAAANCVIIGSTLKNNLLDMDKKPEPSESPVEVNATKLNEDLIKDNSEETSSVTAKREKQRRRHRYQTKDLIREVSPKLEDKPTTQANDASNSVSNNDLIAHSESINNNQPTIATATPSSSLSLTENDKPITEMINGKRTVQCNICKRHMIESKLANHIRLLHVETSLKADENKEGGGKKKEFRCEHCGKSYAIKYTFHQHLKTHTEGRPKCPECGHTFASAFSLFRHRAKTHNLEHNYTTHGCDQCDKTFFSVSELNLHQQRHSTKKDHECPECKKAFSVKGNLRIHMRTHAKEKLYKCDICENTFSHPYSLVSHRRIHTNEFPFQCTECGKTYRSKHQLTSHQIVHSDIRPFRCETCDKTFRSRTAFKMHQDQHNGIKRFTCKFCDRRFQCHANKLKHERRHVGLKRHKCEFCDKAFIEKQELRNHLKVHERQNSAQEAGTKIPKNDTESKNSTVKTEEVSKTAK